MKFDHDADAERLINILLSPSLKRDTFESMAAWFQAFNQQTRPFSYPIDRAVLGARMSLSLGFSFAGAYQSAIEALFKPSDIMLSSLCVTEEKGNHPRSIDTRLYRDADKLYVTGKKNFVSGANDSQYLYIACRDERQGNGLDSKGRPIIKILALKADCEGIDIVRMPNLNFIPEVSHGKVNLDHVCVQETDIYPEDGYIHYLKAFRSYEDLHVLAAVTAYRLAEAVEGKWSVSIIEAHVSLILAMRSLVQMDLTKPSAHIGLSACRTQLNDLISSTNPLFASSHPERYQHWCRDQTVLTIAEKAHDKRTQDAWNFFKSS